MATAKATITCENDDSILSFATPVKRPCGACCGTGEVPVCELRIEGDFFMSSVTSAPCLACDGFGTTVEVELAGEWL